MIQKVVTTEVTSLPDSRQIKFLISTGSVDRDGDTIDPKGWQLDHYKKSPVVLWSHDYSRAPIAKTVAIAATLRGLEATAEFPAKGVYPFADQVYDMLKGGFLSATSVGFRAVESRPNGHGGNHYVKQELLEWSVVPVPANPEALMQRGLFSPAQRRAIAAEVGQAVRKTLSETMRNEPVCTPTPIETEERFMQRCMADRGMQTAYPDHDGRTAECNLRWLHGTTWPGVKAQVVLHIADEVIDIDPAQLKRLVGSAISETYRLLIQAAIEKYLRRRCG